MDDEKIAPRVVRAKSCSGKKHKDLENWMNGQLQSIRKELEKRYGKKWKEYGKDEAFEAYFVSGETFLVQTIAVLEGSSALFKQASRKREECLGKVKSSSPDKWFEHTSKEKEGYFDILRSPPDKWFT